MILEKELTVAIQAVAKASILTKRIQQQVITQRASTTLIKQDKSPVTIGDYAAQAVIINTIKANFPQDKVVGEEAASDLSESFLSEVLHVINDNDAFYKKAYADSAGGTRVPFTNAEFPLASIDDVRQVINFGNYSGGSHTRFWCLDPIDGTKGFLRGEQFAVCLALIEDGVVQLGCIGCPNLSLSQFGGSDAADVGEFGYLFYAVRGSGAFYRTVASVGTKQANDKDGDGVRVHVRKLNDCNEMISLEGVEKSHSSHENQAYIKQKLGISKSIHLDSQVKYCMLAMGLADVYLRLPRTLSFQENIWDHAAGNVIVSEAGGLHTDALEGVPLDFGNGRTLLTKGVIASCGPQELHERVVQSSAEVMKAEFDKAGM